MSFDDQALIRCDCRIGNREGLGQALDGHRASLDTAGGLGVGAYRGDAISYCFDLAVIVYAHDALAGQAQIRDVAWLGKGEGIRDSPIAVVARYAADQALLARSDVGIAYLRCHVELHEQRALG